MKRLFYLIGLLLLTVACESDIFPDNRLYQRWQLDRTRQGNGPWETYNLVPIDTEYRRDGAMVYRINGQIQAIYTQCCASGSFVRQGNELRFGPYTACARVACSTLVNNTATITQLTNTLLELTRGQRVTQYRAVR